VKYKDRRAAYAVIFAEIETVAVIKAREKYWLPGGGSLPDETAEETAIREVREELARSVRLIQKIGQATQYFYSAADDCHYKMDAVFFLAEFIDEPFGAGEHELHWMLVAKAATDFFHQCHAWAVESAVKNKREKRENKL
jgi:8-oxo-dGTP pyrophosphatase MutT (NUDIX family)